MRNTMLSEGVTLKKAKKITSEVTEYVYNDIEKEVDYLLKKLVRLKMFTGYFDEKIDLTIYINFASVLLHAYGNHISEADRERLEALIKGVGR